MPAEQPLQYLANETSVRCSSSYVALSADEDALEIPALELVNHFLLGCLKRGVLPRRQHCDRQMAGGVSASCERLRLDGGGR